MAGENDNKCQPHGLLFSKNPESGGEGGLGGTRQLEFLARVASGSLVFIEGKSIKADGCSQPSARLPISKVRNATG